MRDFLFIQISKTDHFEWSKAIIKLKPFWEAPEQKLGVKNDGHGPTNVFMRPKMRKSFLKVMDFAKYIERFLVFYQKLKTAHFLGQFTIRYTWIIIKGNKLWWPAWKNMSISDYLYFKPHQIPSKMIGRAFFKMSKCVN